MKRILIVLISIILALSFVSCEKDKSEEMIAAYTDFVNDYNICVSVFNAFSGYPAYGETELEDKEIDKSTNLSAVRYLVENACGIELGEGISSAKTIKGGKIYENRKGKVSTLTFENDGIKATYLDYFTGDKDPVEKEITILVNGTFTYEQYSDDDGDTRFEEKYDLTINGQSYEIEFTHNEAYEIKFLSAKVDDREVDVRMLNKQIKFKRMVVVM